MTNETAAKTPAEFRYTLLAVASLMTGATLFQLSVAWDGRPFNAIVAAVLIAGLVGIVRKVSWGRRIAVIFLWGSIVISFGRLSPFGAGDLMADGVEPPSPLELGLEFAAVCSIALVCLHYLGKYKSLFRTSWI